MKSVFKFEKFLFYSLILFLPTQLGKHFWPDFSLVSGIRVDYLSPTVYFTDILVSLLFIFWLYKTRKNSKSEYRNPKQTQNTNSKNTKRFGTLNFEHLNLFRNSNFGIRIYVLFCLYVVFNIALTQNLLSGFYFFLKFLEFSFVAFYVAQRVKSHGGIQKITTLLSVGVIFESILAIAQFTQQGSIGGVLYYLGERFFTAGTPGIANASINGELILRPYATFPHPNVLAGYLLICLILILFSKSEYRKSKSETKSNDQNANIKNTPAVFDAVFSNFKLLFYFSLLLGSLALFLTMSRVAIVLWVIVLLIGVFYRVIPGGRPGIHLSGFGMYQTVRPFALLDSRFRGNDKKKITFLLLTSCFLLISTLSLLTSHLSPILFYRFIQTNIHEEAVVHRQELSAAAAKMIGERPLLGVGLGNFLPTLSTIQKSVSPATYLQPVHNIYLLAAAELGIIGFVFLIYFLFQTLLRSLSRLHLFLMFSVILIIGFFDHYFLTLQQGQLLFALVVGLCWAKLKQEISVSKSRGNR